ncbi:hypothetical protein D3C76_1868050 [compost metagenome]
MTINHNAGAWEVIFDKGHDYNRRILVVILLLIKSVHGHIHIIVNDDLNPVFLSQLRL